MRSVIFSLIKTEEIIRSLSCKNPFCAIVKGLRLFKASEEQIPTAMSEETTKRVNYHKNGNLPLFCIEKDTRGGKTIEKSGGIWYNNKKQTTGIGLWKVNDIKNYMSIIKLFSAKNRFLV